MTLSPRERETIIDFHRAGLCLPGEPSCVCVSDEDMEVRDATDAISRWIDAACEVYPEIDPDMMKGEYGKALRGGAVGIEFSDVMALAEKLSPHYLAQIQWWNSR